MQKKYSRILLAAVAFCLSANAQTYNIRSLGPLANVTGLNATDISLTLASKVALDQPAAAYGTLFGTTWVTSGNQVIAIGPQRTVTAVYGAAYAGFAGDGGPATTALFSSPSGLAFAPNGDLYISDFNNNRIRKVHNGIITTAVGGNPDSPGHGDGGPAALASLNGPQGLFFDAAGNLYVADYVNGLIRRIDAATGIITTVVGSGVMGGGHDGMAATSYPLSFPTSVVLDISGDIFIAQFPGLGVLMVSAQTHLVTTLTGAGTGFNSEAPALCYLGDVSALAIDNTRGRLWIGSDTGLYEVTNFLHRVSVATPPDPSIAIFAPYALSTIGGLAVDGGGSVIMAGFTQSHMLRFAPVADPNPAIAGGTFSIFAGNGFQAYTPDGLSPAASQGFVCGAAYDSDGTLYYGDTDNHIRKITGYSSTATIAGGPGVPLLPSGDFHSGPPNGIVSDPCSMVADRHGHLLVADYSAIRRVDLATGIVSPFATVPNHATAYQLAADKAGNLFVADANGFIYRVDAVTANMTVVAGNGTLPRSGDGGPAVSAGLFAPSGVAVDSGGNLFIAEANSIRRVDASTGIITTVAGTGTSLADGVPGVQALIQPVRLAFDPRGNLLFTDWTSGQVARIRRLNASGLVDTVAGTNVSGNSGDGGQARQAAVAGGFAMAVSPTGDIAYGQSLSDLFSPFYLRILTPQPLPFLTASILSKADAATAGNRVWTFNINNTGPGVSLNPRIANITETLTGPGPVIFALQTPTPLGAAIQPGTSTTFALTLSFPVTTPATRISLTLTMTDDSGQVYTVTLNNLFR